MISHSYLVNPYLMSLQKLALEADLMGFTGVARGTRGLLIQETLRVWLETRGEPMPEELASPEPQWSGQTSLEAGR
jgi:hypothetical protein